jgi:hypothetical protein
MRSVQFRRFLPWIINPHTQPGRRCRFFWFRAVRFRDLVFRASGSAGAPWFPTGGGHADRRRSSPPAFGGREQSMHPPFRIGVIDRNLFFADHGCEVPGASCPLPRTSADAIRMRQRVEGFSPTTGAGTGSGGGRIGGHDDMDNVSVSRVASIRRRAASACTSPLRAVRGSCAPPGRA